MEIRRSYNRLISTIYSGKTSLYWIGAQTLFVGTYSENILLIISSYIQQSLKNQNQFFYMQLCVHFIILHVIRRDMAFSVPMHHNEASITSTVSICIPQWYPLSPLSPWGQMPWLGNCTRNCIYLNTCTDLYVIDANMADMFTRKHLFLIAMILFSVVNSFRAETGIFSHN